MENLIESEVNNFITMWKEKKLFTVTRSFSGNTKYHHFETCYPSTNHDGTVHYCQCNSLVKILTNGKRKGDGVVTHGSIYDIFYNIAYKLESLGYITKEEVKELQNKQVQNF